MLTYLFLLILYDPIAREKPGKIGEIKDGKREKDGTGNFPEFFGKNQALGKWHSGTQTSM